MANSAKQPKISLKKSQSMMTSSFNMGKLLKHTALLLARNYNASKDQNVALDLFLNENNVSRESRDNESCYSTLRAKKIIDCNEKDIAELDQILSKLESIGVKIRNVENN